MLSGQQLFEALQAMSTEQRAKPIFASAGCDENGNAKFAHVTELTVSKAEDLSPDDDSFGTGIELGDLIILYDDPETEPYSFTE